VLGHRLPVLGEGAATGALVDVLVPPEAVEIVPDEAAEGRGTSGSFLGRSPG